jgi:L-amino acid N-acyltransferase YncA
MTDGQEDTVEGFPKTVTIKGQTITVRMMTTTDGSRLRTFAQQLSDHDLLFLRRDITKQSTIDTWVRNVADGTMYTVLAEDQAQILGYGSLYRNDFDWSRHVAELRVLVAPQARNLGLGRLLTREAFNVALTLGIEKIVARMTPDQTGARTVFEELGFRPEALLRNEVKDRSGKTHDILLMANDVATFLARGEAYGIPR